MKRNFQQTQNVNLNVSKTFFWTFSQRLQDVEQILIDNRL